ncbi:STAS domain-containing protein [Bradyrhizobium sp. SRS-191]|uniref:STAS domain-containing protein n=1 Tax=Bradyrhizobium sp. SRS-191 TaxID=2962606 RepID=UPI00211DBF2A|nr:STAS domain-containing protein [Bradyrhizobium sp. SRS-191]
MTDANATNPAATDDTPDVAHALPQMLDLTQAAPLRDEMVRLAGAGGIALDASGVERMSTPCVQILLAAGRGAEAASKSFKITQASELFRTAVAELGLRSEFDKWME